MALAGRRIMLLFPHMTATGGALTYTLRLAGLLAERGAVVAILTLRAERTLFRLPSGVTVVSLDGPLTSSLGYWLLFPFWQRRLNAAIRCWKPDLIVPQVFPANWWGWLHAGASGAVPLVWVCHEPSAFIHSRAWIKALRPAWKSVLAATLRPLLARIDVSLAGRCHRIVANSRFTAREVLRVYGRKADAVACPGIDLPAPEDSGRLRESALLTVGRLTRFKRVDFLLQVFSLLNGNQPGLTFHIVGTGEEERSLKTLAAELGLEGRVVFHGNLDQRSLESLYRRVRLYLHGSIEEPFGMAPLEALSRGVPVVAWNGGGPAEYVTPENGLLLDSLDPRDWADGIVTTLAAFSGPQGERQVRESVRHFSWSVSLQPAVDVIDDVFSATEK